MHSPAKPASIPTLPPLLVFSILAAVSLAIWWTPLLSSLALAWHDDQYTHILLILPISAALVLLDWKTPEPPSAVSVKIGSLLLFTAVLLTAIVRRESFPFSSEAQLSLNMLALVVWWLAAFYLCFGARAFRRELFPLCFLLWMVPPPPSVLNPIIGMLQQGSARAAHLFFFAARLPVTQNGTLLFLPGLTLEVAPECSSIRSSLILLITMMVVSQLLLRSFWRKLLVVVLAVPVSLAKNGLRIFVLGLLAIRVDPGFLTGNLHRQGGIIYFLIALVAMLLLIWILRTGEKAHETGPGERAFDRLGQNRPGVG